MKKLLKDEKKVAELIEKLLSFLGKQGMWGIDILYALCYAQAEVMYRTIKDLDGEGEDAMIKHLSDITTVAIKTIRKTEEEKEDEK